MSTQTTNLKLVKPAEDDLYDISVQNGNMDIIDKVIGKNPQYYSYATDYNGGTNGSGLDFNELTQVGFHQMGGNFSDAKNAPKNFYGDNSVIVIGKSNRLSQMVVNGDTICFRNCAWNGSFSGWKYTAITDDFRYNVLDETYLTTPIKDCTSYTDLFSQLPDRCLFLGHTWDAPSWFPNTLATNWHVRVEKYDNASVWIELYSDAKPEWNYKAGWAYGTSWSGWTTYMTEEKIKQYSTTVNLSSLTWTQSTNGKYYTKINTGVTPKSILSVRMAEWNMFYPSDMIQVYSEDGKTIGIMSNTNSFHTDSSIYIIMMYM